MSLRSAFVFMAALLFAVAARGGTPTTPFPTPLTAVLPAGSLIYTGSTSGTIASPGETDAFSLNLDADQTITSDVVPGATLQPTVSVRNPAFALIGSATAAGAGQEALLQTVPVSTAGTYTIEVSGAGGTTGTYTLNVTLNAALEAENHGGGSNNTIGTAQDLASSFIPLPTGSRAAAVGSVLAGNIDFYAFTLSSGPSATIAVAATLPVDLALFNSTGAAVALGTAGPSNVSVVIRNFVAAGAGTYYVRLNAATDTLTNYSLVVTRDADFDIEGNDTFAGAQDLRPHDVLGAIGNGGCPDSDFYAFGVNAGDNLVLTTATPAGGPGEFVNGLFPELGLYDNNGNLVAAAAGNAGDGRNSVVNWTALTSGFYRAQIVGSPGTTGEYVLSVNGETGTAPAAFTPSAPTPSCTALTAASPAHLWIGLKSSDDQGTNFDLKTELLKNGNVVATGLQRCITGVTRNASLAKEAIVNFDSFSPEPVASNDVISLRVSTRVGTNPDNTKCAGHNSATGLRLYYDAANRESRFDATIAPSSSQDYYLHSDGTVCGSSQSSGVTTLFLNTVDPLAANPRCRDSGTVNFSGGNPFSVIGTWNLAPLP